MKRFWRSTTDTKRTQFLSSLLDRNGRWIEVADTKAGAVLVFVSAVAGLQVEPTTHTVRSLQERLLDRPTVCDSVLSALLLVLIALVGVSGISAARDAFQALIPDTRRHGRNGHLFFGDIAQADLQAWSRWIAESKESEIERELAEQVHTTAAIASNKHRLVNRAIRSVIWITIPFGIMLHATVTIAG